MWSDNETELDAINVQHAEGAVVDLWKTPHLTPITIRVFGPWSIGKSSVAKMVHRPAASPGGSPAADEAWPMIRGAPVRRTVIRPRVEWQAPGGVGSVRSPEARAPRSATRGGRYRCSNRGPHP